jgi:hypothetical protein
MAVLAQTPVVAEATPVGALSAQRRSCWLEERWVAVDRGCVKTSSRFHTSLFRSLLRGLRAFRVEKIAKNLALLDRLQNVAEFLHGLGRNRPY